MRPELPVLQDLRDEPPGPRCAAVRPAAAAILAGTRSWASIVRMLRDGPVCVCEMAAALGERQNNVSNHLAKLREGGLVRPSRVVADTRRVYYERDHEGVPPGASMRSARYLDDHGRHPPGSGCRSGPRHSPGGCRLDDRLVRRRPVRRLVRLRPVGPRAGLTPGRGGCLPRSSTCRRCSCSSWAS